MLYLLIRNLRTHRLINSFFAVSLLTLPVGAYAKSTLPTEVLSEMRRVNNVLHKELRSNPNVTFEKLSAEFKNSDTLLKHGLILVGGTLSADGLTSFKKARLEVGAHPRWYKPVHSFSDSGLFAVVVRSEDSDSITARPIIEGIAADHIPIHEINDQVSFGTYKLRWIRDVPPAELVTLSGTVSALGANVNDLDAKVHLGWRGYLGEEKLNEKGEFKFTVSPGRYCPVIDKVAGYRKSYRCVTLREGEDKHIKMVMRPDVQVQHTNALEELRRGSTAMVTVSMIETALAEKQEFTSTFKARPVGLNGAATRLLVTEILDGGLLHRLGVMNKDQLYSVNGKLLGSRDTGAGEQVKDAIREILANDLSYLHIVRNQDHMIIRYEHWTSSSGDKGISGRAFYPVEAYSKLRKPEATGTSSSSTRAMIKTTPNESLFLIDRDELENHLTNLPLLLTQARAVPYFRDGKSVGLRLFAIKEGSLYQQMGLKNGDILHSIDGRSLSNLSEAMRIFEELRERKKLKLTLERNRSLREFTFKVHER